MYTECLKSLWLKAEGDNGEFFRSPNICSSVLLVVMRKFEVNNLGFAFLFSGNGNQSALPEKKALMQSFSTSVLRAYLRRSTKPCRQRCGRASLLIAGWRSGLISICSDLQYSITQNRNTTKGVNFKLAAQSPRVKVRMHVMRAEKLLRPQTYQSALEDKVRCRFNQFSPPSLDVVQHNLSPFVSQSGLRTAPHQCITEQHAMASLPLEYQKCYFQSLNSFILFLSNVLCLTDVRSGVSLCWWAVIPLYRFNLII